MNKRIFLPACLAIVPLLCLAQHNGRAQAAWPSQSDLTWSSPGKDAYDAIPSGNGDIGVSMWVQKNGELLFYISKTDAYDDNNRLLKLGLIRVSITPNPFSDSSHFLQQLKTGQSEITVQSGTENNVFKLRFWVDANHPAIHLEMTGDQKFVTLVRLENWRRHERPVDTLSHSDCYNASMDGTQSGVPTIQYPDSILSGQQNRITWFHQNHHSCWPFTLKLQGLEQFGNTQTDPLLNNIFGATIYGNGLGRQNDTTLRATTPVNAQNISVVVKSAPSTTPGKWLNSLNTLQSAISKVNLDESRVAHRKWWKQFWDRSYVNIQTDGDTGAIITRSYMLQRYMVACSGRGTGWIKFNGSLFTLPAEHDADFRKWGSAQWFQNARLIYWPLIACGDYDVLAPFYSTFLKALPLVKERTRLYYNHNGAFFSETAYAWGTYANPDYGYDRKDFPPGLTNNTYIRRHWSGGLELSAMMLEQFHFTNNRKFLTDTLLPIASEVVRFFDQHWKRGKDGKINFDPAQSLETWQTAVNPMPEIAGLRYVLSQLLELAGNVTTAAQRAEWQRILNDLPALPMKTSEGKTKLLPASVITESSNSENPELYAIFPFRLFGVGKPSLETARNTYAARINRGQDNCWYQDNAQAAYLGLADEAAAGVTARMRSWDPAYRFPAMWGPSNDEVPDMDHGGVGQLAIQAMLMQSEKEKILLFPAWPKRWSVSFKMHAPMNTVIEGTCKGGKIQNLVVTPASRRKDVIVMPLQ